MRVEKFDNNTSFGINTINYTNFKARDAYRKMFLRGNNSPKEINKTFYKIFDLKPKTGPDVDLFITKLDENENNASGLIVQLLSKTKKVLAWEYVGNKSDNTHIKNIEELYNACKKAVNSISENRR